MFNTRMTSAGAGAHVALLVRIEGPFVGARLRRDQVDALGLAMPGGMFQRNGTPTA